jgi:hypothetical protein
MLEFRDDLAAEWLLELWEAAPTPQEARHLREASIAAILKRNRIPRLDAASVRDVLRKPPVQVAAGTVDAASAHVASLVPRIRLLNRQIKGACRPLDALTAHLVSSASAALPSTPSTPSRRTVSAIASRWPAPRTTAATPRSCRLLCAPIRAR